MPVSSPRTTASRQANESGAATPKGRGAAPLSGLVPFLPVVRPEVVLLKRDRLARGSPELVVRGAVVRRRRVDRRLGLVRRLHPQAPVALHASASRDQLADDDVLLEAD